MKDNFNERMLCITHFVFLHGILRRWKMLLTFSRYQMMLYSVLKLHIKGTLSYGNKVKNKVNLWAPPALLRFMLHSRVSNHNYYYLFLNLSTFLCHISLEISLWWRLTGLCWYPLTVKTSLIGGNTDIFMPVWSG